MVTQTEEYVALRQEITVDQGRRDTVYNIAISSVAAIFGFSIIQINPLIPLLALPIALLGSLQVANLDRIVSRIGHYILYFIEPKNLDELHWETIGAELRRETFWHSSVNMMHLTLFIMGSAAFFISYILFQASKQAVDPIWFFSGIAVWIILWVGCLWWSSQASKKETDFLKTKAQTKP